MAAIYPSQENLSSQQVCVTLQHSDVLFGHESQATGRPGMRETTAHVTRTAYTTMKLNRLYSDFHADIEVPSSQWMQYGTNRTLQNRLCRYGCTDFNSVSAKSIAEEAILWLTSLTHHPLQRSESSV